MNKRSEYVRDAFGSCGNDFGLLYIVHVRLNRINSGVMFLWEGTRHWRVIGDWMSVTD